MKAGARRIRTTTAMCGVAGLALAMACLPLPGTEPECESHSGARRVAVIELYTSEGCSSCPPADRWVSSLPARGFHADRVVPLAFHVDYWDYLGWRDRFAQAGFSARQRAQAGRGGARFVYTPQLLLNGVDFRQPLLDSAFPERLARANIRAAGAELRLAQRASATGVRIELESRVLEPSAQKFSETYVALLENNLSSRVRAGENSGKVLLQDFVVREFIGPMRADGSGRLRWSGTFALHDHWKRPDLGIATFVQDTRDGDVLQALHAPLCSKP
jgi:hypothetical protein